MYQTFIETKREVFTETVIDIKTLVTSSLNQQCMVNASKFAQGGLFGTLKFVTNNEVCSDNINTVV